MEPELEPGRLVTSKAGRDAGRRYLVVEVLGKSQVAVADGTNRRLSRPKRKNVRHLRVHSQVASDFHEAVRAGKTISDAKLQETLARLIADLREEGEEVDQPWASRT